MGVNVPMTFLGWVHIHWNSTCALLEAQMDQLYPT